MEIIKKDKYVQHLAGIVPIAGQPLDFEMPWHDSLMPIGKDYLAVERAVFQCAMAGCETIWIVGYLGAQPLVRKRIGDTILDPNYLHNIQEPHKRQKEISIYYVPIHPKDRAKRDCLGWSVLYGADSAYRISKFISKWIAPEKFFCSFPYGIVPDEFIQNRRQELSSERSIRYSHEGKTVKDNLHLPFTFNAEDYFRCRDIVKFRQAEEWGKTSARFYDLATVFNGLGDDYDAINVPWFYDISSWERYKKYLSAEPDKMFEKPSKLFKGNKRNNIK